MISRDDEDGLGFPLEDGSRRSVLFCASLPSLLITQECPLWLEFFLVALRTYLAKRHP